MSDGYKGILFVAAIRARMKAEIACDNVRQFIKNYIVENQHNKDTMIRFCFIIRTEYPEYKEYLENVLLLL